ncbi:DUF4181 domain-containing protein [Planococcus dechangensis]
MDGMNRMDGMTGMTGYYSAPTNWVWALIGFLVVTGISIALVNWLLRKILKVERKKLFAPSSNYVNGRHEKVDGYFRWGGAGIALFAYFASIEHGPTIPLVVIMAIGAIQELYTAYMEKRHSDNPNDYKYTLLQLLTGGVIVITCLFAFFPDFVELML